MSDRAMSAMGQKQTCAVQNGMSALPPIADMCSALGDVRFVPITDIKPHCLADTAPHYRKPHRLNFFTCEPHHADLTLERPRVAFVNGMRSRRIVSCCSDLDLINAAKLLAGRQQLSPSLAWHRLLSQQL
jgi:hypothetical protein